MRFPTALLVLLCPLACAHGATVEKLELDTYRITCAEVPLDRCLAQTVSNACNKRAYFVERGISDLNNRGRSDAPDTLLSSQAIIRCGPEIGWGDQSKALMSPAPAPVAPKPAAPAPVAPKPAAVVPAAKPAAPVCAPGATQACVGPAGCTGGQACRADGTGYEPCDCGQAATPTPPVTAP